MIATIALRSLRNASFISYCDGIITIGSHHDLLAMGLKPASDAYAATIGPLNAQYAIERGSGLTDQIVLADKRRDRAVSGIWQVVQGHLNHFDPAVVDAAKAVDRVFAKYGSSIQNKPYAEQSGIMKSLSEDLQAAPASGSVAKLGLTAWVVEMKESNQAFIDLYGDRTTEKSQKPSAKMFDLRMATIEAFQKLSRSIAAVNELNPSPALQAYAAELNAHIEQYNRLIGKGGDEDDAPEA